MTEEEFENLADEQLVEMPEDIIRARSQAMLARELLKDVLPKFGRRITDMELLSPPFFDEAARRWQGFFRLMELAIANPELQRRYHRLGELEPRWRELREIMDIGGSMRLYLRLVTAKEWYDGLCQTKRLLSDDAAEQSAVLLRAKLRNGAGVEWDSLVRELTGFLDTRQNPPDESWSLLPRQDRDSAFRTFVVRLIAESLREYTPKPMIRLIADLTTATLPDSPNVVTEQQVRTALGI